MTTAKLPAPLDHYTATIRDLNTIVITAHFIAEEDGFIPEVSASHMTINLSQPISEIDSRFLGAEGGELYMPCDLAEFYSHADDETTRAIMIAEGKDPEAEYARWAGDDAENEAKERLFFHGYWTPVEERLPEEQTQVLVIKRNSPNAQLAERFQGRWMFFQPDDGSPVEFWAPAPQGPDHAF